MKVVSIVGARPQFIKCAPVSRKLRKVATEVLVHTGQHYDDNRSEVFFRDINIPRPDYNLWVGSGPHGEQTGEMLKRICLCMSARRQVEEVLMKERPDYVLVYGDTNSTLAGALASARLHICLCVSARRQVPVAHVEAGLRSFNKRMPEEINRVLLYNLQIAGRSSKILAQLHLQPQEYLLATVHRAENTEDVGRLQAIVEAFQEASTLHPVVWPVHPRIRQVLGSHPRLSTLHPPLCLIDPVSYLDMLELTRKCQIPPPLPIGARLSPKTLFCKGYEAFPHPV